MWKKLNERAKQRPIAVFLCGMAVGCLIFYLPGVRYYYTKEGQTVVRINRITGTAWGLGYNGWEKWDRSRPPQEPLKF